VRNASQLGNEARLAGRMRIELLDDIRQQAGRGGT
jgi:hypothetical protein